MNLNTEKQHFWQPSADVFTKNELNKKIFEKWNHLDKITDIEWLWEEINGLINIKVNYAKDQSNAKKIKNLTNFSIFGKGNIIEKIVDTNVDKKGNQNALVYKNGVLEKDITFEELQNELSKVVSGLKEIGFKKGDRAIIAMPFIPEGLYSFLGVIKMGGVSVPLIHDFNQDELASIIEFTQAKVLFTVDSILNEDNSKYLIKNQIDEVLKHCPSVEIVIVVNSNHEEINWKINRDAWWDDLVESQQLTEPVDTTNTGEPHIILYLPKEKSKGKNKKKEVKIDDVKIFSELFKTIKEKNSDFTYLWLSLLLFLYNFKLESS